MERFIHKKDAQFVDEKLLQTDDLRVLTVVEELQLGHHIESCPGEEVSVRDERHGRTFAGSSADFDQWLREFSKGSHAKSMNRPHNRWPPTAALTQRLRVRGGSYPGAPLSLPKSVAAQRIFGPRGLVTENGIRIPQT